MNLILLLASSFGTITALSIDHRIVGGQETRPNKFPFVVSINIAITNENVCGGTILSAKWILTAGHCIHNKTANELIISAGKHYIWKRESGVQYRRPIRLIVHENFSSSAIGPNDIGLVELTRPLVFTNKTRPIDRLPKQNETFSGSAIVLGWGLKSDAKYAQCLRMVNVSILPHKVCTVLLFEVNFTEKHLCTGPIKGERGPCSGDSGGPLIVYDKNRKFTIIGIVAFSNNPCGRAYIPPGFTKVSSYAEWIDSKINNVAANKILNYSLC